MNKSFFQVDFFGNKVEEKPKKKTQKNYDCEDCKLYLNCNSPKMKVTGAGKLEILIIAEAPGRTEDEDRIQLVGKSGQLFRDYLEDLELDLDYDFWKTNAIICRPPRNKTPTNTQLRCCRRNLLLTIEKFKPKGIILLGKTAVDAVIGYRLAGRLNSVSFSDLIGECIPDQEMKTWLCTIYHPSYILRNDYRKDLENLYSKQIENAIQGIEKDFPVFEYDKISKYTKDESEAIDCIKQYRRKEIFAFDYETTGIKPHRKGHEIVTASLSDGTSSMSFPFFNSEEFRHEWKKLLTWRNKKIAHVAKFENQWTKNICGYYVNNMYWDTAIGCRCLNNLKPYGLKLWVYIYFGVIGYDSSIDTYIKGKREGEDEKSDNAFNRIKEAPIDKLLKYNSLDSLFTFWLYEIQNKQMLDFQKKGFFFFMEGTKNLLVSTENGIRIDENNLDRSLRIATNKIKQYENLLKNNPEIKKRKIENFNFKSGPQLAKFLYTDLGIECPDETEKGNPKTDKDTLAKIDNPFVKDLLQYRRWLKAKDPYISQYKRESINGFIHCYFNLNRVRTFRGSSNSVNFQNNPIRDKRIMKTIRSFIIPRKGNRLVEYDFKGMEVCVAACYTKDPNLIKYINNPKTDMHRDCAADLFLQDRKLITKQERYIVKSYFVFASFYGDYYEHTAPNLWNDMLPHTKKHLKEEGIKNIYDFISHIQDIEYTFWNEKFPVYKEWKEKTMHDYEKKGYIDLYTGFRCYAPMKKNEVINYRIQGSAFHILLWIYNYISPFIEKLELSFLLGQIHDSAVTDTYPEDEKYTDNLILESVKKVREHWNWIIVPLTIEKESSEIDGSWAEMKSQGVLV